MRREKSTHTVRSQLINLEGLTELAKQHLTTVIVTNDSGKRPEWMGDQSAPNPTAITELPWQPRWPMKAGEKPNSNHPDFVLNMC